MLKIYGLPISVHTRKVLIAAIEKRLPYENDPVIPFAPPPGWTELSPTGKIPVVVDGEAILRDSSVICVYLERTYPDKPVYPRETMGHVRALWFEEYADSTIFRDLIHGLFFQKIIRPTVFKEKSDGAVIEAILTETLPRLFGYLERSLEEAEYLAAGVFSIADIAVVSNLINFHYLGYRIDAERFPKLATFFRAQLRHPSIKAALAAEQKVAAGMGLDLSFVRELMPP